jgi:hypothetical protein
MRCIVIIGILSFAAALSPAFAQSACDGRQVFTARSCEGDAVSADETVLFEMVNRYRRAQNKTELKLSPSLSMLANRRMLDLKFNVKKLSHSWSDCPYLISDKKTWGCVIDAPKRLKTGYTGQGYETLYRTTTGKANPELAITAWKKSTLHNSIILNLDTFRDLEWDEFGVAIDGEYAALWFGCPVAKKVREGELGLGVSYEEAVEGLTKTLAIDRKTSARENMRWTGTTADKKLKLELTGRPEEIRQASVRITISLDQAGKLDPQKRSVLTQFLQNLFPEWNDIPTWLETSTAAVARQPSIPKTKLVRKIEVHLGAGSKNSLILFVKPASSKSAYFEVF